MRSVITFLDENVSKCGIFWGPIPIEYYGDVAKSVSITFLVLYPKGGNETMLKDGFFLSWIDILLNNFIPSKIGTRRRSSSGAKVVLFNIKETWSLFLLLLLW